MCVIFILRENVFPLWKLYDMSYLWFWHNTSLISLSFSNDSRVSLTKIFSTVYFTTNDFPFAVYSGIVTCLTCHFHDPLPFCLSNHLFQNLHFHCKGIWKSLYIYKSSKLNGEKTVNKKNYNILKYVT